MLNVKQCSVLVAIFYNTTNHAYMLKRVIQEPFFRINNFIKYLVSEEKIFNSLVN